jgi:Zn-dependent M28 family amino/carboxypeptidase
VSSRRIAPAAAVAVIAGLTVAASAPAKPPEETASAKLRHAVSADAIVAHNRVLEGIAALNRGNRVAGTPGHDASALYVASTAAAAGLDVRTQEFDYDYALFDFDGPELVRQSPRKAYVAGLFGANSGGDFGSLAFSPDGDVTAPVFAVDLKLPPPAAPGSTSGCEAADFAGMPKGAIALIQRGTCNFAVKFANAEAAGAGAVVIFNEGQPGRTAPQFVDGSALQAIPGVYTSFAVGNELANGKTQGLTGQSVRVFVDQYQGSLTTRNVIAETRGGDPNHVLVLGAHLDSVPFGPGINDNGSGSGAILEIARQLRNLHPKSKIRFIWFSAEESGDLGSAAYIDSLPQSERDKIDAMLNFDMIASPNFARFVYDGDLSDSEPPDPDAPDGGAPAGSAEIEHLFNDYFASQGLPTDPTAFDGRSDYGPFIAAGIPAGGLFTGAEGIKTPEQQAKYGGTAGEQYDHCYHLYCDTLANLNRGELERMADAAAHATAVLAELQPGRRRHGGDARPWHARGPVDRPHRMIGR